MVNNQELEIRFPYDEIYISVGIYDYNSKWLFICDWLHTKYSEVVKRENFPDDQTELEMTIKNKAIDCYITHTLRGL